MIRENAPAKINLALHVTGQRSDGYHLLDSLVVFVGIGDTLTILPAPDLSLSVDGPMARGVPTGPENLILKAAALYGPGPGAAIALDKHLPHAAGIGGGSADAAATLRGLSRAWGQPLPPLDQILTLGADVPVCLSPAPQRMQDIGETLTSVPALPPLFAVLVTPGVAVPTGPVFRGLTRKINPPMEPPAWTGFAGFISWLTRQRNDLEPPAVAQAPVIGQALNSLRGAGAALARMSGSGATCFGLFDTAENAAGAARSIRAAHPKWWVQDTAILTG